MEYDEEKPILIKPHFIVHWLGIRQSLQPSGSLSHLGGYYLFEVRSLGDKFRKLKHVALNEFLNILFISPYLECRTAVETLSDFWIVPRASDQIQTRLLETSNIIGSSCLVC